MQDEFIELHFHGVELKEQKQYGQDARDGDCKSFKEEGTGKKDGNKEDHKGKSSC
jgi:hypothetical protein